MTDQAQIILNVPRALKGAWVAASRARGMKLTEWICEGVSAMDEDFGGFTLNVPAFLPFEQYARALPDGDARDLLKRLHLLDTAQADAVAAIKIARSYLEKRVAIADGMADKHLFHDINTDALGFYAAAPGLTHADLIRAVTDAT